MAEKTSKPRWIVATNNQKKLKELALLLGEQITFTSLVQEQLESPVEDGLSFVENALIKARYAARHSGLPSLADDSGLVIPAFDGAPGLYSARYAFEGASDAENNQALIAALKQADLEYADAHYHCTLVFMRHSEDPDPLIAQGRWSGRVYPQLQGSAGFGYDPMFYLGPNYDKSVAELDPGLKARLSHRGIALRYLQQQLVEMQLLTTDHIG